MKKNQIKTNSALYILIAYKLMFAQFSIGPFQKIIKYSPKKKHVILKYG